MMNLHVYDEGNHLYLTGFYLPSQAVFSSTARDGPLDGTGPAWTRIPDDQGMAHILTIVAKQLVALRLQLSGPEEVVGLGLETWVLRAADDGDGRLGGWFAGEPAGSRYRVLIHRMPRVYRSQPLPLLWDEVYAEMDAKGPALAGRNVPSSALHAGAVALGDVLAAYREGPTVAQAFVEALGHPYRHVV